MSRIINTFFILLIATKFTSINQFNFLTDTVTYFVRTLENTQIVQPLCSDSAIGVLNCFALLLNKNQTFRYILLSLTQKKPTKAD